MSLLFNQICLNTYIRSGKIIPWILNCNKTGVSREEQPAQLSSLSTCIQFPRGYLKDQVVKYFCLDVAQGLMNKHPMRLKHTHVDLLV